MVGLFDIGGTKTRVAVADAPGTLVRVETYDTPQSYTKGVTQISETLAQLAAGTPLEACAGGIRGRLSDDKRSLRADSVLLQWQEQPLADDLSGRLMVPVVLENDAALAGLGEACFGAGKGFNIVAYHTVSTGVGGARIEGGKISAHAHGFEPGHQTIDIDQTLYPAYGSTKLEDHVSGTAVEKRFGKKPYDIPQEDPLWDELAAWLAHGLKNTIVYWSPDVIVLGGSMVLGDPRILQAAIQRHTEAVLGNLVPCPPIVDAQLGSESGLYGALALSRDVKEG